jgi:hypothetical protein
VVQIRRSKQQQSPRRRTGDSYEVREEGRSMEGFISFKHNLRELVLPRVGALNIRELVLPRVGALKVRELVLPRDGSLKTRELVLPRVGSLKKREFVLPRVGSLKKGICVS